MDSLIEKKNFKTNQYIIASISYGLFICLIGIGNDFVLLDAYLNNRYNILIYF